MISFSLSLFVCFGSDFFQIRRHPNETISTQSSSILSLIFCCCCFWCYPIYSWCCCLLSLQQQHKNGESAAYVHITYTHKQHTSSQCVVYSFVIGYMFIIPLCILKLQKWQQASNKATYTFYHAQIIIDEIWQRRSNLVCVVFICILLLLLFGSGLCAVFHLPGEKVLKNNYIYRCNRLPG